MIDFDLPKARRCASSGKPYSTYVELDLVALNSDVPFGELISLKATDSSLATVERVEVVDFTKSSIILSVALGVQKVIQELDDFQLSEYY